MIIFALYLAEIAANGEPTSRAHSQEQVRRVVKWHPPASLKGYTRQSGG
jgi:hypothetical protein